MHKSPLLSRLQPQKKLHPTNFICVAPQAATVTVVGDFNQWNPKTHPLKSQVDGSWSGTISLPHGHHRYAFLVDGALTLDPHGKGVSRDDQGNRVSLISVS
jgi:1,4-alpha-glucan branching enzyme